MAVILLSIMTTIEWSQYFYMNLTYMLYNLCGNVL